VRLWLTVYQFEPIILGLPGDYNLNRKLIHHIHQAVFCRASILPTSSGVILPIVRREGHGSVNLEFGLVKDGYKAPLCIVNPAFVIKDLGKSGVELMLRLTRKPTCFILARFIPQVTFP